MTEYSGVCEECDILNYCGATAYRCCRTGEQCIGEDCCPNAKLTPSNPNDWSYAYEIKDGGR